MSDAGGDAGGSLRRNALIAGCCIFIVAAALAAGLLSSAGSGSQNSNTRSGVPVAALNTSFVTSSGTWAIVPMGDLGDPLNTFWQLLFKPTGASKWSLVTPPGVADNGGLAATVGRGKGVAVVFDPTHLLTFSPVAFTSDDGTQWSAGVIPFGADAVPDAIVEGPGPGVLYALESGGDQVRSGTGGQQSWSTVLTRADLEKSPSAKPCGVVSLTALAVSGRRAFVGAECAKPGTVGVFSGSGNGAWTLFGPRLSTSFGKATVLRLSPDGAGLSALVAGQSAAGTDLYGMWESPDGRWTVSGGWSLSSHASIVSESFGPGGELVVETKSAHGALQLRDLDDSAGSRWDALTAPPAGAEEVAVGVDGSLDALCVGRSTLFDWRLDGNSWAKVQTLEVPIQYGSSG